MLCNELMQTNQIWPKVGRQTPKQVDWENTWRGVWANSGLHTTHTQNYHPTGVQVQYSSQHIKLNTFMSNNSTNYWFLF